MQNYSIPLKYYMQIALFALLIEILLCIFKGEYYMRGWHKAELKDVLLHISAFLFLLFFYIKKNKNFPDFTHCKQCKKIYNYSDTKDMICPKCGGKLQDYAEFEKDQKKEKQDEFKEAEKFQEEWIKQIKEERKNK